MVVLSNGGSANDSLWLGCVVARSSEVARNPSTWPHKRGALRMVTSCLPTTPTRGLEIIIICRPLFIAVQERAIARWLRLCRACRGFNIPDTGYAAIQKIASDMGIFCINREQPKRQPVTIYLYIVKNCIIWTRIILWRHVTSYHIFRFPTPPPFRNAERIICRQNRLYCIHTIPSKHI